MGTEVALSFSTLRAQLENERSSLYKIDENIKKIVQTTGRFVNDRLNNSSTDFGRNGPRLGGRNFPESGNNKNNDPQNKRKHETKTVFSRLSARVDSDGEEEGPGSKRVRVPSAVSRELPTRAAVLRAQGDDEQARKRNRRIFGSLLGTLQKFKQEEIVLQTKEDKKAQVERKIEEQARQEKEREQKERKTLFAEREHKKATIKALEAKMARVQEFEKWEESQKCLGNFILTKAKPHLYWIPKKMTDKANEKLTLSRKFQEKCMIKKREELQEELQRIEQHCLRPRGPGTKENYPDMLDGRSEAKRPPRKESESSHHQLKVEEDCDRRKRDKFAMDVDEKEREESDGEERQMEEQKVAQSQDEKVNENNESLDGVDDATVESIAEIEPGAPAEGERAEHTELVEPTEQTELAEQTEVAKQTEQTELVEPVEPTAPVEQTEPVEPTAPVEQTEPVEQTAPVEQTEPAEQTEMTEQPVAPMLDPSHSS